VLTEVNKEGITLIIVTHEASVAEKTKRIIHLKDGIIESDVPNTSLPLQTPSYHEVVRV